MNPPANTSAAADIRAEREKACQEVLASCVWRQHKTPPPLRESPPRSSKTAALASIASQLHRPPPEEHAGYVPVATVVAESSHCSVSAASAAVGRAAAITAN
jgi:hypothetical protein